MGNESEFLKALTRHLGSFRTGEVLSQIGALCIRQGKSGAEVLLITTRESGRWIIPKGWPIEGLKPHQVAEREAWEEAGVRGNAEKRPMGHFTYIKGLDNGKRVPSIVAVHKLKTQSVEKNFPEKGERKMEWHPILEAAVRAEGPELRGLIASLAHDK
jgi:8-oxo-dGTP pyrophosphatase MutT (NUDIX family)